MIACLIPAHNEQATIARTLDSVLAQTRRIDRILVVADNCTDGTYEIAELTSGPIWTMRTVNNRDRKAGALNQGYLWVVDYDFVMTMDADTILAPDFVERTVAELEADPGLGGVCARYWAHVDRFTRREWLTPQLQRLEYAAYDANRELRDWNVSVLSGAAVMYRGEALRQVVAYRERVG